MPSQLLHSSSPSPKSMTPEPKHTLHRGRLGIPTYLFVSFFMSFKFSAHEYAHIFEHLDGLVGEREHTVVIG